jgi:O-antigen/teichoic acid export membrane protein
VRVRLSLDPALRQLLRNAGWLLVSDGTVLVAGLLGTLVAARALGAPEFGRITLVWSVVGVAHLLVDVRAWEAVTRYLSEFTSQHQTGPALATLKVAILVEAAVAVLGFGLVWVTSAWVATRLFGDPALEPLILLGAMTLVVGAFDRTARAVLRVFDRFRVLGLCSAIEAVTSLVLVVGAVAAGAGAKGVLVAHLAAALAGALMLLAVSGREVRARLWPARAAAPLAVVLPYWREMLAFVGHSAARATLKVVTRRLDLILLGYFRPPAEVGTYGAALRLAQILEEVSDPLYFAAFPQLARA